MQKTSQKNIQITVVTFCNIKLIIFTFAGEFATAFANAVTPFIVRLSSKQCPAQSFSILLMHYEIAMKPSSPMLFNRTFNDFN